MSLLRRRSIPMFSFEVVLMLVSTLGPIGVGLLILLVRAIMRVAP